jgi:CHAT domain-containing protein
MSILTEFRNFVLRVVPDTRLHISSRLRAYAVLTPLLLLCSCHGNPNETYFRAERSYEAGNVELAGELAQDGYRHFHALNADWAWKFLILRARVLHWFGMDQEMLNLFSSEPSTVPFGELTVQKKRLEAAAYGSLHSPAEAERKLREAETLCTNRRYRACADVLSARGVLAVNNGHYNEGELFFRQTLAAARTNEDRFLIAYTLLNLSWCELKRAHFDQAIDWAEAARQSANQQGFVYVAQAAVGNLAWAYYKLGEVDKAQGMFLEAERRAETIGDLFDQLMWIQASSYIYLDKDNIPHAEEGLQRSLVLATKSNYKEHIVNSLIALAFVSEQTGKLDDAKRYADQALTMARADGNGRDIVYPLLVEGRVAAHEHDPTTAEANFREVAKSPDTPVFLKWEAERSLARLYEDENQFPAADTGYRTALTTFENARCGMHERVDSRLPFLTNAARIYEDYIHFLVTRGRANEALRVADYARARTLAEGLGRACKPAFAPDPLNPTEIARRAGGTVLFYALGQNNSYLWIVTQNGVRLFPLPANQAEVDAAVQRYRKKLEGPPDILAASNDAGVLYQTLIAPAESFLKNTLARNQTIFIIPDAGLNSLNFETLMPKPGHYWIEDVTIANAPSLRFLPQSRSTHDLAGKLLLIGNPAMQTEQSGNAYPELPNAAAQMQNIQKYFSPGQQQIFARDQASPAAYLSNHPEQFSYIHFVAHGTASRTSPLDSAIILSANPASTSSQDNSFKLYARDIIGTPHLHAELVTISACYSTGNRTYSGEGLVGLSWAFLRAGAHNVIAALWDVSDASSPELVDKFYGELKRGKSPSEALRTAKLSLLHSNQFHSPFYWAPFQLYTGS